MSTILHTATSVIRTCPATFETRTQQAAAESRSTSSGLLRAYQLLKSLCEGLAVYRQFERLQSWGISRDEALRQAFGQSETRACERPDIQR